MKDEMKFLFIIQGEGRGHFSQALVMQDMLRRQGDEVVACLVGKSESRILPDYFLSQMKADILPFESPNFLPAAQNKRPNLIKSVVYNLVRLPVYIANMVFIKKPIITPILFLIFMSYWPASLISSFLSGFL